MPVWLLYPLLAGGGAYAGYRFSGAVSTAGLLAAAAAGGYVVYRVTR